MILLASDGLSGKEIALKMGTREARVSKWLRRFALDGIAGLNDSARSAEKRRKYTAVTEKRILQALDEPAPAGYSRWNGRLLAEHLGDVSKDQVWRVMRKHDLHLERRQSWCVSTDPEFSRKAADVVGLYLNPPQNALVLCVDEKPCIQALERAQGWIRLPNGRALTGFAHEYKRHGTTTLFAALEVATGLVHSGHYRRRRRREFLDFMNDLVAKFPGEELHVVLDNLNTHKPKEDRWLKTHPQVHFHFIPTHSSWLNQVECWFSILSRSALQGSSFTSVRILANAGGGARLAQETKPGRFVTHISVANDLQGHRAPQVNVKRLVSDAHCSATQLDRSAMLIYHHLIVLKRTYLRPTVSLLSGTCRPWR
jgi:transposase